MNKSTIAAFWIQQVRQIKEEGFEAIWRKFKTLTRPLIINLLAVFCIPLVLIIRLIKPWYWIRFGWIFGSRIGHFAPDVEYYLTERKLGLHPEKANDIFFYRWGKPANIYFSRLTKRYLFVRGWTEPLFVANNWLPGGDQHKILPFVLIRKTRDTDGLFRQVKAQLTFTDEENQLGHSFLELISAGNQKYVCLIVRNSSYLKWASYHNYRDSDINTYSDTALMLAEKGYVVLRMGKKDHKPFNVEHANIIDYAFSAYRSDFLDIWLMANCFFCISTGTGLDEVSRIFRRPAIYVNYVPFQQLVTYDRVISIPKHMVWQETNKQLTLSEHLFHSYSRSEEYEDAKIKVQDLSPEEILQAVLEMENRLEGSWEETEEDQQLQDQFWGIFRSHPDFKKYHGKIHPSARVGAHFLRNNPEWLN